jgi:hypothetical protein
MKNISVILAFHAQEPSWDLPERVVATLRDDDIRREAVGNDNWVRRRAQAGRDIYRDLVDVAHRLQAPVSLEATNEVLMQVRRYMPETFARLRDAYRDGTLYPVYGNAFHTHIAMVTDEELADKLRLNQGYLHDILGAPVPRHAGAFPMEGSIDARKLDGFRRAGIEYVIFPNVAPGKMRYAWEEAAAGSHKNGAVPAPAAALDRYGNFNIYSAFLIGHGLLALPRHFRVSQEIWRPITKWQPQRLTPQGYILGKYAVLDEEYRSGETVRFPIAREEAVDEYAQVLRDVIAEAPDGALLLYIQDLELMDFGEEALQILGEAWTRVRGERLADVRFVTPDDYVDAVVAHSSGQGRGRSEEGGSTSSPLHPPSSLALETLPRLRFSQASWAPEIRLCLRSDGHYPPLHAGPHRGVDSDEDIFRRWPLIFWEPGRFISETFRSLLHAYGHSSTIPLDASQLDDAISGFSLELPPDVRLAIHLRAMQRACNFGWQPDEDRHKWPYMHGLAICEILRDLIPRPPLGLSAESDSLLHDRALRGLDRVLEVIVDTRVAYLRGGIDRLGERAGDASQRAAAEAHLRNAEKRRARASALARTLRAENARLRAATADGAVGTGRPPGATPPGDRMLALLHEHCKESYLAINELQRAWMQIQDVAGMIEEMYTYLYDLYPPLMPRILRDIATDADVPTIAPLR